MLTLLILLLPNNFGWLVRTKYSSSSGGIASPESPVTKISREYSRLVCIENGKKYNNSYPT